MGGESIWLRARAPGTTGRPALHSRGEIVAAAIAVADGYGLAAVTMRRVAQEVGTGAASLYRHLDTRDDLVDLMIDHALADYEPPQMTGESLHDVVADLIERLRFVRARPWLIDAIDERPTISPERIRLIELSLERLEGRPAPGPAKVEALGVVAGMVHSQARHERDGGALDPPVAQAQFELLHRISTDGAHPHLAAALAGAAPTAAPAPDEQFARVLTRTLTGLLPAGR